MFSPPRFALRLALLSLSGAGCAPGIATSNAVSDTAAPDTALAPEDTACGADPEIADFVDCDGDGSKAAYDCDDHDANRFPSAPDPCGSSDDDCDPATCLAAVLAVAIPWVEYGLSGPAVTFGPDFSGDGQGELLLADAGYATYAYNYSNWCESGGAWVLPGGLVSERPVWVDAVAPYHFAGSGCLGSRVLLPGDVDGGGLPDVLLVDRGGYSPSYWWDGRIVVVAGEAIAVGGEASTGLADIELEYGLAVEAAGDLDGDGSTDSLITGNGLGWAALGVPELRAGLGSLNELAYHASEASKVRSLGDLDGDGLGELAGFNYVSEGGWSTFTDVVVSTPALSDDPWLRLVPAEGEAVTVVSSVDIDGSGFERLAIGSGSTDEPWALLDVSVPAGDVSIASASTLVYPPPGASLGALRDIGEARAGVMIEGPEILESGILALATQDLRAGVVQLGEAPTCLRFGSRGYLTTVGTWNGTDVAAVSALGWAALLDPIGVAEAGCPPP